MYLPHKLLEFLWNLEDSMILEDIFVVQNVLLHMQIQLDIKLEIHFLLDNKSLHCMTGQRNCQEDNSFLQDIQQGLLILKHKNNLLDRSGMCSNPQHHSHSSMYLLDKILLNQRQYQLDSMYLLRK